MGAVLRRVDFVGVGEEGGVSYVLITEAELVALIKERVKEFPCRTVAAAGLCVSLGYLDMVLYRYRHPGPSILEAVGYEKVVLYRKKEAGNKTDL